MQKKIILFTVFFLCVYLSFGEIGEFCLRTDDCGEEEFCFEWNCVLPETIPCKAFDTKGDELLDNGKNFHQKGYVEYYRDGKLRQLPDKCCSSCDKPDMLYEEYCDGTEPKLEIISCSEVFNEQCFKDRCYPLGSGEEGDPCEFQEDCKSDLICYNGQCMDSVDVPCLESEEISRNVFIKGYTKGVLNGKFQQLEDTCCDNCETPETIYEWYCEDNKPKVDKIPCENFGAYCANDKCAYLDFDSDGIPDSIEPETCQDSKPLSKVDKRNVIQGNSNPFYGCSCEQSAEKVEVLMYNYEPEYISCSNFDLIRFPDCPDGLPSSCCNGVYDDFEFLIDCGYSYGSTCGRCEGYCTKVHDGGDLDILFVPVGYSGSPSEHLENNFNDWVERIDTEMFKVLSTPPFDQGHITFWTFNVFGINKELRQAILTGEDISTFYLPDEYDRMCPVYIDKVVFTTVNSGKSYALDKLGGKYMLVRDRPIDVNTITHELGHAVCGLADEYIDGDLEDKVYDVEPNCDSNPVPVLDDEGDPVILSNVPIKKDMLGNILYQDIPKLKCKWEDEFPDAGCIPGCGYREDKYRPANPPFSMMYSNYIVGPGDNGMSSWNIVSFTTCQEELDKYDKG